MMGMVHSLCVLFLAIAFDWLVGEPPTALHPVVWLGNAISTFRRHAPKRGRLLPLICGLLFMVVGITAVVALATLLVWAVRILPTPAAIVLEAFALKATFSIRALLAAGREVNGALVKGDLIEARRLLAWHLVSRDVAQLDEQRIAAAAIESMAENTSDSCVAPLLFYAVAGLPGAAAYRFINTCDAMLGYRDAEREWLGKAPARIDDIANLLPARATAGLILAASVLLGSPLSRSFSIWRRDRWKTASPNAGQPMSAAAGALGVELEKVDHYRLGDGLPVPQAADIERAAALLTLTIALCAALVAALLWLLASFHGGATYVS